ncbi:hypothetical protein SKAU_G00394050 [Synaphobranchus kaupii]|uniref:Uncharacterized protein n=1 Tax=Synaphobranchus kaupii TaxID=118154 RepID=A0A9Q1IDW1_SYNKA|nr:hypothetical protein SKAU_G00394050 [Synaphobranchus kaupii]
MRCNNYEVVRRAGQQYCRTALLLIRGEGLSLTAVVVRTQCFCICVNDGPYREHPEMDAWNHRQVQTICQ